MRNISLRKYLSKGNKYINKFIFYYKFQSKLHLSKDDYNMLCKFDKGYRGLQSCLFNEKRILFFSPFWFLHSVNEIFVEEVYKFSSVNKEPIIIDCGANIGLSILYFKEIYKNSKIIAFEADPFVFEQLTSNISEYNYEDIKLINSAVWNSETKIIFKSEGSVGGRIKYNEINNSSDLELPTSRLRNYLLQEIDFLKIDIEGAEYEVLKDCKDVLINVKNLFVEYHVFPEEDQHLHEILDWINAAGFKYYIRESWNNMQYPFLKSPNDFYQMQLNIFCYKK